MRGLLSVVAPVVAGLGILWPTVLPAQRVRSPANIIIVTNTNDSGPGSFRQALADVEDGDTIQFDSALNGQTITLTSAELVINNSITISGPGANLLAVNGASSFQIFHVTSGT